jgi:hypothetical protein
MADELYTPEVSDKPAPKKAKSSESPLDKLKATIAEEVERPVVLLEVPAREGVQLRISPNISQSQMRHWRKQAGEESKNGLDPTKFACYVIGHTTTGVEIDGQEVFDDDGVFLNFAHADILQMTGETRPVPDAVRSFFGTDPHIEAAALAVLEAAGYSDTVETVDPTNLSSTI